MITLDPSYRSNPYIIAASLADTERWPELAMPSSPQLSEDDGERPSGFPGARLKHTQTIMGGRTGGLGMRVHAKRASTSKRLSGTPRQVEVKNFVSDNAPVQESLSNSVPAPTSVAKSPLTTVEPSTSQPQVQIQEPTVVEEAPVAKVVQFIPKFKGAAEMEARRRVRMAARRGPGGVAQPPPPPNLDFSSSDEDIGIPTVDDSSSSSGEFDDDAPGEVDSMDEGDEFDL